MQELKMVGLWSALDKYLENKLTTFAANVIDVPKCNSVKMYTVLSKF